MARALLITNPVAARTTPAAQAAVQEVLTRAGWRLEVVSTAAPGDAGRFAARAVQDGVDVVAVQGGDGTTMQAAAALVGTGVSLGMIPGGTGNVLAGNLRIPRNPRQAAATLVEGVGRRIDLGRMPRAGATAYFGVACGTGPDARVMAETSSVQKRRWGMGAYVATTLRVLPSIRRHPHVITVDGVRHELDAAMVLVANCGELIPPGARLGREIRPDDGVLDVVMFQADGMLDGVRTAWQVLRDLSPERRTGSLIRYARGQVVTVETGAPEPVEMDGELDGVTPFTAEVVPGALTVVTPRGETAR